MLFTEADIPPGCLLAYMAFLPEQIYILLTNVLKLYKSEKLRPLVLSNSCRKLAVSCLKVTICAAVDSHIHAAQKCIAGKCMLGNVLRLDLDYA